MCVAVQGPRGRRVRALPYGHISYQGNVCRQCRRAPLAEAAAAACVCAQRLRIEGDLSFDRFRRMGLVRVAEWEKLEAGEADGIPKWRMCFQWVAQARAPPPHTQRRHCAHVDVSCGS